MKKILIIEDEPQMRQNIAELLRRRNYEPVTAENGRLGLEMASRDRPDLILCDITMPELDGHEVLRALRADLKFALVPFIFLTANGDRDCLRRGMNLGADDYLTKPVGADDLICAIETRLQRAVQQRLARRELEPDFFSAEPLVGLGLTRRAAETLLWVAQGKTNADIAAILRITESTVKKHVQEIFDKLGVETRNAAAVRALEVLGLPGE